MAAVLFLRSIGLLALSLYAVNKSLTSSSLQTLGAKDTILNLEKGHVTPDWGRIIFYVEDVDRFWAHPKEKEFSPQGPEMQHGARSTSIYTIQTATNCHLPSQSAKAAKLFATWTNCCSPRAKKWRGFLRSRAQASLIGSA